MGNHLIVGGSIGVNFFSIWGTIGYSEGGVV